MEKNFTMNSKLSLKNKNILITGVGKGIGYELLKDFANRGAFVYGLTRSKTDLIKIGKSKNFKVFLGDVRDEKKIEKIFRVSKKDKRFINGLVNNAGIRQRIKFENIKKKEIKEIFDINFFSIFRIMQIYFKYTRKYKIGASIVNIGSIVGEQGFDSLVGYASSKGALKSLTQSFAIEKAKYKIRANLINPGFIKTSYYEKFKMKKKLYNWTLSRIPQKRWGEPEEISALISFLISDASNYITGETINIDGGWTNS